MWEVVNSNPLRANKGQNWNSGGRRVRGACGSEISGTQVLSRGIGEKKSHIACENSSVTHRTSTSCIELIIWYQRMGTRQRLEILIWESFQRCSLKSWSLRPWENPWRRKTKPRTVPQGPIFSEWEEGDNPKNEALEVGV